MSAHDLQKYYEMGEQAALRGDAKTSMPKFRRADRCAFWINGFQAGLQRKQRQDDRRDGVDKQGLDKIRGIIAKAGSCR